MRIWLLLILFPSVLFAQTDTVRVDISENVITPKSYIVPKVQAPPKIDGKADKVWGNTSYTDSFIDIEGTLPVAYDTRVKMLWDENYLYVFANLEEPHVWGNLTTRDTVIYLNNDFEVFIDPSQNTEPYGEIEINALNTVWDLLLNKPYRVGGFANFHWNLDDLKTAVHIEGTLNRPKDKDTGWTVEMAIPLKALIELKKDDRKPIKEGDQWRINFSRVQWQHDIIDGKYRRKQEDGKFLPEQNWVWSNQGAINMHMPENWGIVQFTTQQTQENVSLNKDPDFLYKQVLYALFRETIWGRLKYLKRSKNPTPVLAKYTKDKSVATHFQNTVFGFEITLKSPETGNTYGINEEGELKLLEEPDKTDFTIATWVHGSQTMDSSVWIPKLAHYDSLGISEILVGGSPEFLQELVELAARHQIRVHAWMWTLNRPNDTIANKHPEWYAVNRNGDNSLEYRAYVDYYQWLSPFHPEAREYIKNNVRKLLKVDGLASIHLDYVRYVDVILGADLQPKYGLVQGHEMPEYDYGYHPIARTQFKELFGKDPIEMEHPELSTEWRQFRLNAVTSLVNEIAEEVHQSGHHLSAAVFPFPEMSRQMVRQAWDDWNLDYVFPMIYHNFYRENINWIGFATEQGLRDVDYPLYTGLYLPGFNNSEELKRAIELAKKKGAAGVSLFTVDGMKKEFESVFMEE